MDSKQRSAETYCPRAHHHENGVRCKWCGLIPKEAPKKKENIQELSKELMQRYLAKVTPMIKHGNVNNLSDDKYQNRSEHAEAAFKRTLARAKPKKEVKESVNTLISKKAAEWVKMNRGKARNSAAHQKRLAVAGKRFRTALARLRPRPEVKEETILESGIRGNNPHYSLLDKMATKIRGEIGSEKEKRYGEKQKTKTIKFWNKENGSVKEETILEWEKKAPTTKHNHEMIFGRKAPKGSCPRCDELHGGAKPVKWGPSKKEQDAQRSREIDAHFNSEKHKSGKCGSVCTFGES